jgi:hypothetical protein
MYGPEAVSEQALTEHLLDRLPKHSVLLGDINLGVFSVAFAATQRGHDVLLRVAAQSGRSRGAGLVVATGVRPAGLLASQ